MNFYLILLQWNYLKKLKIKSWFLAGGITFDNVNDAIKLSRKIDISSSLEDNPGNKSEKKVKYFLEYTKKL